MKNIDAIARRFNIKKPHLIDMGVIAYLKEKKGEFLRDRLDILSRYGVSSERELERLIKKGKVKEHPAWEDLITLENISDEIRAIDEDIRKIRKSIKDRTP